MVALRESGPATAYELSETIIVESVASGYERCLPEAYITRADGLRRVSKNEEATEAFERAIAISRKLGDRLHEGRATNGLGIVAKYQENFQLAQVHSESAVVIADEVKDTVGKGLALKNLADVFDTWGLYDQATEYSQSSYEALRGTPSEIMPLYKLAHLVFLSGDDESALALYQRVLDLATAQDNKAGIGAAHSQMGEIYFHQMDYVRAREHFQVEGDMARPVGNLDGVAHSLRQVAECEIELGEFDSAEEKCLEAFRINGQIGQAGRAGTALLSLATLELKRGNATKALEYISDCEARKQASGDRQSDLVLHEGYSAAYEQLGNWQKVAYHEKERHRLSDEKNSIRFKGQLSIVQNLLATERERKDTEIQRLRAEHYERELANSTLQLLAQTELLSELRDGLLQFIRKFPLPDGAARELRERLKALPCKAVDWEKFDTQFKSAHPEFTKKLIEKHPTLSPTELRICSLVRMNLKSEDIARLLCLSERTVENHRNHVRQKMKLKRSEELAIVLAKM
jgi:tetratricopeptide (TPR) repeat protein/DNA-binding CsgD family transcriptional regulator